MYYSIEFYDLKPSRTKTLSIQHKKNLCGKRYEKSIIFNTNLQNSIQDVLYHRILGFQIFWY